MDDYLESNPTVEETCNKAKDLVKLLAKGGFKLTKFVSNVDQLPFELEPNLTPNQGEAIPSADECSRILGFKWNHSSDTLVVSRGTCPDTTKKITQSVVLSLVSEVYDSNGHVAPYTVQARFLLKDIWRLSGQIGTMTHTMKS